MYMNMNFKLVRKKIAFINEDDLGSFPQLQILNNVEIGILVKNNPQGYKIVDKIYKEECKCILWVGKLYENLDPRPGSSMREE